MTEIFYTILKKDSRNIKEIYVHSWVLVCCKMQSLAFWNFLFGNFPSRVIQRIANTKKTTHFSENIFQIILEKQLTTRPAIQISLP